MKKMLIAIAVVCLIPWNFAKADDAPLVLDLKNLQPVTESKIVMEKEKIEYTITEKGEVTGSVDFTFYNPTDKKIVQDSIFPIESNYGESGSETYANDVKVFVDGRAASSTFGQGQYPIRSEDGAMILKHETTGVIFSFSVPAKGRTEVLAKFVPNLTWATRDLDFSYYYGSGAGWSGKIGSADVVVNYPYDLQPGWSSVNYANVTKKDFSGKKIQFTIDRFEPKAGDEWINFWLLQPSSAKSIIQAQAEIKRNPKSADAYQKLADAYRATADYHGGPGGPELSYDDFARRGYWDAIGKKFQINYGKPNPSYDDLQTLYTEEINGLKSVDFYPEEAAYEILRVYSDDWSPNLNVDTNRQPRAYVKIQDLVDAEKYTAFYQNYEQSMPSDRYFADPLSFIGWKKIEFRDKTWRQERTDLTFPEPTSTADLVSPEPTTATAGLVSPQSTEEPAPQLTYLDASSILNNQALATGQTKENGFPPAFWLLVGFAAGLFSWSGWLWLTRRKS